MTRKKLLVAELNAALSDESYATTQSSSYGDVSVHISKEDIGTFFKAVREYDLQTDTERNAGDIIGEVRMSANTLTPPNDTFQ